MADKLTPQQTQAVQNRGGKLLVSAAAGSGKTKVLVDRLMGYLTDPKDPANLDEFLIITYTKAAASELRGKIGAKLTERIAQDPENRHLQKQMQRLYLTKISTVHGFCSDLLREYAYRMDIAPDFRVADETECEELRETVLKDMLDRVYETASEDPDLRTFLDTQGLGRDDRMVPEIIQKVYDSARCHLDPEGWLEGCLRDSQIEDVKDLSETVWGRYLMDDLQDYLDCQIRAFRYCTERAAKCDGLKKQADNLKATLESLENLRKCDTWDSIVSHRELVFGRLVFPKNNPEPELTEQIKAVRNACKKEMERKLTAFSDLTADVITDMAQTTASARALVSLVKQFTTAYDSVKRSRRCLDFSDLEHKTLDLLLGKSRTNPTAAATEIGRRFREIMVDEYQDSNGVQNAIFTALTMERRNCFMVGDVKQSIYQFRLADPSIFLKKYHSYVLSDFAQPMQGRKVLLSHNFRSGPEIIEAVNGVFRTCMGPKVGGLVYGEAEELREGIPHDPLPGPCVELYGIQTIEDAYAREAAFVADKIKTMLDEGTLIRKDGGMKPVEPEDIVILLRSPSSTAADFQRALEARGIRCFAGSGMDLLDAEEIGTLRSFLQTILNPRQDIPLISTLASPVFGFTADDLATLRSEKKKGSFYDALLLADTPKAKHFLEILEILRQEARLGTLTSLLRRCFTLTRMDSVYAAMSGGEAKAANLQTFYQMAADFEQSSQRDLAQFLDQLTAMEGKGLVTMGSAGAGCVSIMSIHKSKGLEFPVVFLSCLARRFNQESLRGQILCDKELGLGLSVADGERRIRYPSAAKRAISVKMAAESVSEEMRVLYVAMTRARDRLIMTYASKVLIKDLSEIALRMDADGGVLLCRDAVCLGDWVLRTAMERGEAGEFHALAGRPKYTRLSESLWKISAIQAMEPQNGSDKKGRASRQAPEREVRALEKALAFRYPYAAATQAPSKQTATGRKGRVKDAEAAEDTREPVVPKRTWRMPSFCGRAQHGSAYGSAIHAALQYLSYENCGSSEEIAQEIKHLAQRDYITEDQAGLVNCEKLARFFESPLGKKLRGGTPYLREFKFSILDEGDHYGDDLEGEKVLLQGVVDCALLEEDGITIIDFKTDYITEETVDSVKEHYRPQVETYGEALRRIYEMPIKAKYLYFFHMDRFEAL